MRLYIAVLNEVPDFIVPTLVAHTILGADSNFIGFTNYEVWKRESFKKCVVKVNQKEFDKIAAIEFTYLGHENKTLDGKKSCAIPLPVYNDKLPNVLKFAKLWKPNENSNY